MGIVWFIDGYVEEGWLNYNICIALCSEKGEATMNELEKIQVIQELNKLSLHELKAYISVCDTVVIKKIAIQLYDSKIKLKILSREIVDASKRNCGIDSSNIGKRKTRSRSQQSSTDTMVSSNDCVIYANACRRKIKLNASSPE